MHLQSLKLLCPRFRRKCIYKKYLIWPRSHEALPSTSCDLCTCKIRSCYGLLLRRCFNKKIHCLTLTQRSRGQGHMKCPVSWTSCDLCTIKFGPAVKEMSFKDISSLELWQPLCSVDWNHLCNIERRHHEEQPCEIILNLDQWFRRRCR